MISNFDVTTIFIFFCYNFIQKVDGMKMAQVTQLRTLVSSP